MKSILNYLTESIKPWRPRSEVFILKDDKLVVGYIKNNNYNGYVIPGGGIDMGETPERAAKRECLEEIGIKVKDLKLISVKKIAYHEDQKAATESGNKYARNFSGAIFFTFVGSFVSQTKINKEFEIREITIEQAIDFFEKNTKRLEKEKDQYNLDKSKYVAEVLKKIAPN
jgi:8-oxo-dGTP pyrophosphatase MutT (NUDIX family)